MAESMEIEMYKPSDLSERLKYEQDMLEKYFNSPGKYPILYNNNEWYFEHEVEINEERKYKLRAYVSNQYPDVLPDLVVCESPEPMPKWEGSHETHTWGLKHEFLQICHWHWAAWKRENLICQVFEKGEEWLQAYEKYLKNGNLKLDLKQMKLEEDEKVKVQRAKEQQIMQFHQQLQQALSIFQPDFNDLRDILSQRDLRKFLVETQQRQLELAYREVMENNSENLIAEMVQTQNAIIEYKAVWPPRLLRFLLHVFLQPEVQRFSQLTQ